ncbi:MAG: translocation and assembly module TamB, partial [Sphingomonadales bacterium]|nr:translocation and assembly module TamB [Sphingomonadales bacterium]
MEPRARRRLGRWIALALAGLLLAALLILWLERKDIAAGYIDRELARRGVRATYTVRHLGFGVQRLDDLVLGDPAHPDLTARWVELRLSWGFRKPRISLVTGRGVRLYGRVVEGRLRFGELDKLLPKPSGAPFRLPDLNVDVSDTAVRIDTPGGRIGAALEGKGNLASGFEGRTAVSAPRLRLGGCALAAGKALWNVATETLQPSLAGPARFDSLACGGNLVIRRAEARLGVTLSASLAAWRGEARVAFADAQAGLHRIDSVGGNLTFAGGLRDTRGHADLAAAAVHTSGFAAGRTRVNGVYSLSLRNGRLVTALAARAAGVAAPPSLAAPILSALRSARGTPVEPVAAAWGRAVTGALRRFDASADIRLAVEGSRGAVRFARLATASAGGARLSL